MTEAKKHRHRARQAGLTGTAANDLTDYDVQLALASDTCAWCGKPAVLELDHVIALTRTGSTNTLSNVVGACRKCNASKGRLRPHEFGKQPEQPAQFMLPGMPPRKRVEHG